MSKDTNIRTLSKNISTKDLILNHALLLFNKKGIEYVGVREIAKGLNIRVGNVTYYFPTKDDIVAAHAAQLAELNGKTIVATSGQTITGFLEMYKSVFENHYQFRCLFISFVQQLERNKKLQKSYMSTQEKRFTALKLNMEVLIENKYLISDIPGEQLDYLVASLSLIARFWLSEARIRFRNMNKKQIFDYYLKLIAYQLLPFTTKKGEKEINLYLSQL